MRYSTIYTSTRVDLIGGFYDSEEMSVHYADTNKMVSISIVPTSSISSDTEDGINFDNLAISIDGNRDLFTDLEIGGTFGSPPKKSLSPKSHSLLATPGTFDVPISPMDWGNSAIINSILSKSPFFTSRTIDYATDKEMYFLLETAKHEYMLGLIQPNSSLMGTWNLRYKTWSVFGRAILRGGLSSVGSNIYAHARLAESKRTSKPGAIISSHENTGSKSLVQLFKRMDSGVVYKSDEYPNIDMASLIISYLSPMPPSVAQLGQMAEHGDLLFISEGTNLWYLDYEVRLPLVTKLSLSAGTFHKITSLLVRRDPSAPEGISRKVQLILADYDGTTGKTIFYLVNADFTDSKSVTGVAEQIKLQNLDGTDYADSIKELWDLSWASSQQTEFYMPEPGDSRITKFRLSQSGNMATYLTRYTGIPAPRTVLATSPTQLYVICKNQIGSLRIDPDFRSDAAVQAIGLIPFSAKIKVGMTESEVAGIDKLTGLANTMALPNWPIYVKDIPFGDTISLMINHELLSSNGIGSYEVFFQDDNPGPSKGKTYPVTADFSDLYKGHLQVTHSNSSKYSVREDPTNWLFPSLAAVIDTQKVLQGNSGIFTLHVKFYEKDRPAEEVVTRAFSHKIRIDNRRPTVKVHKPVLKLPPDTVINMDPECESLGPTDAMMYDLSVQCDFALDGGGFSYNIVTYKGPANSIKAMSEYGTTTAASLSVVKTAGASGVLGTCSAALMRIGASVSIPITNGYESTWHGAVQWQVFALYKKP